MSKIKKVMILHQQGMSNRDIASEIGINKGTVNEYMRKVRIDPLVAARWEAMTGLPTKVAGVWP